MSVALAAALGLAGGALAGFGLYLTTLAVASFFARRSVPASVYESPSSKLIVLVPAHDEERLIGRTVASLLAQDYPHDLLRVIVIADNCTDRTAATASAAGAEVMVRTADERGKGWALRWAIDRLMASPAGFDAVVVVDADSIASPSFLRALEMELVSKHDVVQADYALAAQPGNPRSELVAAGILLFHRVRLGGRRRLGLAASLVGNGMLFSRRSLVDHPWAAFTGVEDLEHTIDLRLAGVHPRFAPDARIEGAPAATSNGLMRQRMRWEGGRFHVIWTRLPRLLLESVRRRDPGILDAALDLATLPLGLLGLIATFGTAAAAVAALTHVASSWVIVPWLSADALIAAFVAIGLVAARAPASMWRALALAPVFLAWKVAAYARLLRHFDPARWERTDRVGDAAHCRTGRFEVSGVPIDPVDFDTALRRTSEALCGPRLFQVTTVNLDFVVRAQTDAAVREMYRRSDLNVADGAPVVWLARLLGAPMPGRVAGADLVPALLAEASRTGSRVFLLGGEDGAAQAAAQRLRERFPTLRVSGCYEPPRARVEDMDSADILGRIAEAGADLLLVALGNPKQEHWIDLHRDQLPVKVAIGVGCVFDLIAGRKRRAPAWMQAVGLEWAFRLLQEPGRLASRYGKDSIWLAVLALRTLHARFTGSAITEPA